MSRSASSPLSRRDAERIVLHAVDEGGLERDLAYQLGRSLGDATLREPVLEGAFESKCRAKGSVITVSRNVFIPLTNLCRNRCTYCTFAKLPDSAEAKSYSVEDVADVVRGGVATGCTEALLCLGDKPEVAYSSHREWLAGQGFASTTEHLVEACRVALRGGMLPHTNAGVLSKSELEALRPWNASMGLMLENVSPRLRERGMPHFHAPDKDPAVRLRMHEEAGELAIPFTTGLLLGIGENADERVDTLYAMRDLDERYGHIQEVIVQPFHPKPSTRMRAASSMPDAEIAAWVALARLVLGPQMNVQAPPNLAPEVLELLLRSGLNDWGGVSPVTVDYINPEAPWPALAELRQRTEAAGQTLRERLPVYPEHVRDRRDLFDDRIWKTLSGFADSEGYAREKPLRTREEAA